MSKKTKTQIDIAARICPLLLIDASTGIVTLGQHRAEQNHGTNSRIRGSVETLKTPAGFDAFVYLCDYLLPGRQDWKLLIVRLNKQGRPPCMLIDAAKHADLLAAARTVYANAVRVEVAA